MSDGYPRRIVSFEDVLAEPLRNGVYKPKEFHGDGTKIVNMGEIFAHDFLSCQEMKRLRLTEEEKEKVLLQDGDLLFARRSLVLEGSGRCVLVVDPEGEITFESSIIRARPNPKLADPRFLFYLFRGPGLRAAIIAISSRTAVSGIRSSDLARVQMTLPDLRIQRRMAGVLSAYDDLIENNTKRIKILEQMARSLYREWFVNFRFPGHEKAKFVNSKLGKIPEGWHAHELRNHLDVRRGKSYKGSELAEAGGLPFVNLKCFIRDGGFRRDGIKRFTGNAKPNQFVRTGDIVMAVTDMTQERRLVARAARIPRLPEPEAVISMDVVKLEPRDRAATNYLYGMLRYSHFADDVKKRANGANVLHLNPECIESFVAIVPAKPQIEAFGRFLAPLLDEGDNLALRNDNLATTRDLLLPRLISGEIDVSSLSLEPAAS